MIYLDLLDNNDVIFTLSNISSRHLFDLIVEDLKGEGFKYNKELGGSVSKLFSINRELITRLETYDEVTIDPDIDVDNIKEMLANFPYVEKYEDVPYNRSLLKSRPLARFQPIGIKKLIEHSGYILEWDVGCGKTYASISAYNHLDHYKGMNKIIVFTIGIALRNWRREFLDFGMDIKEDDFYIVDSKKMRDPFSSDKRVIILTYDQFVVLTRDKMQSKGKDFSKGSRMTKNPILADIQKWSKGERFGCIMDEIHLIKNPKSLRSKAGLRLFADNAYWKVGLSGTLIPNTWTEIYNPARFIAKELVGGMSYDDFTKNTCIMGTRFSEYEISSILPERQELWDSIIRQYIHKVNKNDWRKALKLTNIDTRKILVNISDKHRKIYQKIIELDLFKLKEKDGYIDVSKVTNRFAYLLLALADPIMIEDKLIDNNCQKLIEDWKIEDNEKFKITEEILDYVINELGDKAVIWIANPKILDILEKKFAKYNPICIHGKKEIPKGREKNEYRLELIEKSMNDPESPHKLLLANPSTVGTAINIIGVNHSIAWTLRFDFTEFTQYRGRYDRPKQLKDVTEYLLVAEDTLDEVAFASLGNKALLNKITNEHTTLPMEQWKGLFEGKLPDLDSIES